MTPQEIFDLFDPTDSYSIDRGLDIASKYWWLEFRIADEIGVYYSNLEETDKESRTCSICGALTDTTEYGRVSTICSNNDCEKLRVFWGINESVDKFWHISGKKEKSNWLRYRIKRTFHTGQMLSVIPKQLRFEFLLMAMIERLAYESKEND